MKIYRSNSDNPETTLNSRINLLSQTDNKNPKGKKIFKISKFVIYLLIVMVLAFLVFSYQVLFTNNSVSDIFSGKVNIFQQLNTLANDSSHLQGESEDRINLLLTGMGGAGHEGPYLTDTIIFISIKPSTKQVSMVSLPRDLLVEIPGYGWWKINNANAFGEQKNHGKGAELTKEVVQSVLNQPVHYYVRVDFAGFEQIIDDIDGIKVDVDKSFTDYQYPTNDFKYQVVSFNSGWQTMDGDTALKFARSRHGNNGEGSDFARSQRQQKILQALKTRVLSYNFLLNPRKIKKTTQSLADHISTDMEPWELVRLAQITEKIDTETIINQVLDDSPDNFLYANIVNEAYVLQPKGDDFASIQFLVKNIFRAPETLSEKQTITVEIRNGTTQTGLASRHSQELKLVGYRINQIGNAPEQNYEETIIYKTSTKDLTEQKEFLTEKYQTQIIENNIPEWISNNISPDLDFFIILGQELK